MAPYLESLVPPHTQIFFSMFVGSGAFEYYYASRHPECLVVCFDSDPWVINMHRWAQKKPRLLYAMIEREIRAHADSRTHHITKAFYDKMMVRAREKERTIEGAVAFYIVAKSSFNGKIGSYASKLVTPPALMLELPLKNMKFILGDSLAYMPRLQGGPGTFVYLDPPYLINGTKYYRHNKFDHAQLAKDLTHRKSRWLLSYNDSSSIRAMYKGFHFRIWKAMSTVTMKVDDAQTTVSRNELLVSNKPIKPH
jgi:site-specific DNA-adenine methylase